MMLFEVPVHLACELACSKPCARICVAGQRTGLPEDQGGVRELGRLRRRWQPRLALQGQAP